MSERGRLCSSQNIDGYLHRIHSGLTRLEELIRKINDMVDNRIESNLKMVSKTPLVDLPQDKSFTFEDFVSTQARYIKGKAQELAIRNAEVERAVNELVDLVQSHPRENTEVHLGENEVMSFRRHYSRLMYQAILAATKASFNVMKKRLGSRASGGFLFVERPIFDVEVQLSIPNVAMSPSLEDIQARCPDSLSPAHHPPLPPPPEAHFFPETRVTGCAASPLAEIAPRPPFDYPRAPSTPPPRRCCACRTSSPCGAGTPRAPRPSTTSSRATAKSSRWCSSSRAASRASRTR